MSAPGGLPGPGVSARGVSALGGCLLWGCTWSGGCLLQEGVYSGGVPGPRGVSAPRRGGGVPGQVPPLVDRQTPVNLLPCPKLRLLAVIIDEVN